MLDKLIEKSFEKSPWLYHVNTGSCNACDIELVSVLTPRYDAERLGFKLVGSPKHADIVVVSGPITEQSRERLVRILQQIPEPRVIVSIGSCPVSGNVFKGSYSIAGPLDKFTPIDVSIAGCPPKPEAVILGLAKAVQIFRNKRREMR